MLLQLLGDIVSSRRNRATRYAGQRLTLSRDRATILFFLPLATELVLALSCGGTAQAATFTVDDMSDAVDANISDGVCATAMGTCTLRAAIQQANALGGTTAPPHTISLPSAGTYQLTIQGSGEDYAAAGDLDVRTNVTIAGLGGNSTIIDARKVDRIFDIFAGTTVTISNVRITNGRITQPLPNEMGGAIRNNGRLTLDSVILEGNESGQGATQPPYLDGGGIYNQSEGVLTILNSIVSGNIAYGPHAGGIYNSGSLKVSDSTISGNQATYWGGGIYNSSHSTTEISGSTISGNRAFHGAGITIDGGPMILTNSTISGNDAIASGAPGDSAAIHTADSIKLVNSTIAGNNSPKGASIYVNDQTATFRSTIIDQGPSACGYKFSSPPPYVSEGFNIDRGTSCGLALRTTLCGFPFTFVGGDQQNVDPQLGPLANNGGSTMTHALSPSSPALDNVPAYYAPTTDQRGVGRPQLPACGRPPCNYAACSPWADVGAYELVRTNSPIVIVHKLKPRSVKILTDNLVLQIEGQGFLPDATIYWNYTPLPTVVRDSTHVEAAVTPELFPRCGNYSITAKNPGADPSASLSVEVDGCDHLQ